MSELIEAPPIAVDMLVGIDAIGRELGIVRDGMDEDELRKALKRTRNTIDAGGLPVWREPGMGIVALRSKLREHFHRKAQAQERQQGAA
jgi:hypothetical protein